MRPPSENARAEKADTPVLKDTGEGFSVFYRGRFLYSRKFPAKIAEEAASRAQILPGTLVLAFSPLLGYGLPQLLEKLPEDSFILAVESDQALFNFSAPFIEKAIGQKLPAGERPFSFFFAETPETIVRFIDGELAAIAKPFRRYLRIDLSAGAALDSAFYGLAEILVSEYISSFWKNRATLIRLGRKYAENIFKNLGEITAGNAQGFSLAHDAHKPIVVAGAGPSLDNAIGFIKRNRSRIFLIAVDAALSALSAAGITADLAVTVEAQVWIDRAFCGCSFDKNSSPPLLADFTSRPKERGSQKPCAFFLTRYAKSRFLDRLSKAGLAVFEAPPLGSVGLSALYIARLLREDCGGALPCGGLPPVFFTGLEFSWGNGFSHAKGTAQVLELHSTSFRLAPVETKRAEGNATSKAVLQEQSAAPRRTNDAMLRYATVCEAYFSQGGFYRLGNEGLPLDFPSLSLDSAEKEIADFSEKSAAFSKEAAESPCAFAFAENAREERQKTALKFLKDEEKRLIELKALLVSGGTTGGGNNAARLEELIREADCLYLHFPDYASEKSIDTTRQDFLNRVRAELDFFLKTIQTALRQADGRS